MWKKKTVYVGFGYCLLLALASICICRLFSAHIRPNAALHVGIDMMGCFVCAVLFYGCIGQVERNNRSFSLLLLFNSISFVINEVMWIIVGTAQYRTLFFFCCLLSKILNLAMIYLFFLYVRNSLHFEGKLSRWADRAFPILLAASMAVVLANLFLPLSFFVDAEGIYGRGSLPWLEDLYLIIAALVTGILIVRSSVPRRQKWAAMSFILIPVAEFLASRGAFAYAAQYGSVLLSLILMYCVLFNDRSRKLAATQTELTMATQIQKSMLPSLFPAFPNRKEFDLYASMTPAREVGGDFYDFFLIDEDHLGLIIADVSGKGVPAALFMMISRTIIQNFAKLGISPAEIMEKANKALCAENGTEMFVTAWVGILEISTGIVTCANAGHEYPALCQKGRYRLLKDRHGLVLGGMETSKYTEYTLQLAKGDKIFVYTDGVTEAENKDQEMFGSDRMLDALNSGGDAGPEEVLGKVRRAVKSFVRGAEQFDDLTMLCLEYRGL